MTDARQQSVGTGSDPWSGGRRQLVAAVVGCVVAASAALFAGTRTWLVETTPRPAPQPELVSHLSGGSLVPLLPALGLVALAGAGGLVATRGWARSAVGVLLAAAGLGLVYVERSVLTRPGIALGWVVLATVAGIGVAIVGAFTLRNGRHWPVMGARYERARPGQPIGAGAPPDGDEGPDDRLAEGTRGAEAAIGAPHDGDTGWWDAIDRGEDPTKG
jgi:hypothetical protein